MKCEIKKMGIVGNSRVEMLSILNIRSTKKMKNTNNIRSVTIGKFTLIELLITIAIIAILAAMLLPALGRAREKAHEIGCVNNQKTIGTYFMFYSDSYDSFMPPRYLNKNWVRYLFENMTGQDKHRGNEFICPSNREVYNGGEIIQFNYVFNENASLKKISSLKHSATTQSIVADGALDKNSGWTYYYPYSVSTITALHWRDSIKAVHNLRTNLLWLDGHVEPKTITEFNNNATTDFKTTWLYW